MTCKYSCTWTRDNSMLREFISVVGESIYFFLTGPIRQLPSQFLTTLQSQPFAHLTIRMGSGLHPSEIWATFCPCIGPPETCSKRLYVVPRAMVRDSFQERSAPTK